MHFLIQNFLWVALMAVSGAMLVWPEIDRMVNGGAEVGTMEATLLMNQKRAVVIDVRSAEEFARARIPGARHLPAPELPARVGELARLKSRPVVLVGPRPVQAMRTLKAAGFAEVFQLRGGMIAWQEAGLPVEKA